MYRISTLIVGFALLIPFVQLIAAQEQGEAATAPLPQVLDTYANRTRERYLFGLMTLFRPSAGSDHVLDGTDVDLHNLRFVASARAKGIEKVLRHDLDGDGIVTYYELDLSLKTPGPTEITNKRKIAELVRLDFNGDGQIDFREVLRNFDDVQSRARSARTVKTPLEQLLALDPNNDGRLTAHELEIIALTTFARFDTDGNGVLSDKENSVWVEARRARLRARNRRQ
ncbi:MAG: hypothetical protein ACR2O4_01080 [Hyphomicrobiaceae bacterium]